MPRRTWCTEIRLWNFATLDPSSREHAPTANACKTEYCAMSLLIRGARVVRNQVRGAVVSALLLEASQAGVYTLQIHASRHVGQQGRSVRNSCGNPLPRMDALWVSCIYT